MGFEFQAGVKDRKIANTLWNIANSDTIKLVEDLGFSIYWSLRALEIADEMAMSPHDILESTAQPLHPAQVAFLKRVSIGTFEEITSTRKHPDGTKGFGLLVAGMGGDKLRPFLPMMPPEWVKQHVQKRTWSDRVNMTTEPSSADLMQSLGKAKKEIEALRLALEEKSEV